MKWCRGACIISATFLLSATAWAQKVESEPKSAVSPNTRQLSSPALTAQNAAKVSVATTQFDPAPGGGARVGGDTCGTATVIGSLPYSDTGDTTGMTDDYNEVCPFTNTGGLDVVYSYTPAADGFIDIDLCNSLYDTKVYVYENTCPDAGNPVGCNDDACGTSGFRSQILGLPVTAANTYYIVVDAYSGADFGTYELNVTDGLPPTPIPECDPGSLYGQNPYGDADPWNAGTSDVAAGFNRADNFSAIGVVTGVRWYGLDLFFDGFGFVECDRVSQSFNVTIYADASGAPGAVICSETVTATSTDTGYDYGATYRLKQWDATFTTPCVVAGGWISIQGDGSDTCWLLWMNSGDGDALSVFDDGTGAGFNVVETFDLSFCLIGSSGGVLGACCDDNSGVCNENVDAADCTGPGFRFLANGTCDAFSPGCGEGACCFDDGTCSILNEGDCITQGGNWLGANTSCDDCPRVCPPGGILENEPCGSDTNGGCNFDPNNPATEAINCGDTICGTGWFNGSLRDTDWYEVVVTAETELTWTVDTDFNALIGLVETIPAGSGDCADGTGSINPAAFPLAGTTGSVTVCVGPGVYRFFVAPTFDAVVTCPAGYTATLTCAPCVLPRGACCYTDGSCVADQTQQECESAGGSWLGEGVSCDPNNPCPQPLPNDNCDIAEVIPGVPFSTTIDTTNALPGLPVGSCNSSSAADMDNDVWYTYTPDTDCLLTINVNPTNYDGLTAVYTGPDCNNLTEIACADEPEPHVINIAATAGTTYWIQIGDWGSFPTGGITDLSLDCTSASGACCFADGSCQELTASECLTAGGSFLGENIPCDPNNPCPQPTPGDNCALPIVVSLPADMPYTDVNTTCGRVDDYNATCMGSYDNGEDAIYQIDVTASGCYRFTVAGDTIWDGIALFDICPDSGTPVCLGQATTGATPNTFEIDLDPGTYYVMVDDWATPDCMNYTMTIEECLPSLMNEDCGTATIIPSVPYSQTVDTSTAAPGLPVGSCNSGSADDMDNDVWWSYTPPADCTLIIDANPVTYDGLTAVYEGPDCNSLTELACADEPEPHHIEIAATAGNTYWIQIGDWGSSPAGGTTDLSVDCSSATDGACCFADGSCLVLTPADCSTQGGSFLGLGTSCDPNNPCPQPLPNDACENCIAVDTNVSYAGSTVGAISEFGDMTSCASNDTEDVWHCWAAECSGDATFSLCGSGFDTTLAIFDECGGLELACNDDSCGLQSEITIPVTAGTVYYIRVAGYNGAEGAYSLLVTVDCCGDLDGDGDVDGDDFNVFLAAFGSCTGDGNYNADADYDSDGCVELEDYQAWIQCYRDANPGSPLPNNARPRIFQRRGSQDLSIESP